MMVKYSTESDYVDTDLFAFYGNKQNKMRRLRSFEFGVCCMEDRCGDYYPRYALQASYDGCSNLS